MARAVKSHAKALLALSDDPSLTETRNHVLLTVDREDLDATVDELWSKLPAEIQRNVLEELASNMADAIVRWNKSTGEATNHSGTMIRVDPHLSQLSAKSVEEASTSDLRGVYESRKRGEQTQAAASVRKRQRIRSDSSESLFFFTDLEGDADLKPAPAPAPAPAISPISHTPPPSGICPLDPTIWEGIDYGSLPQLARLLRNDTMMEIAPKPLPDIEWVFWRTAHDEYPWTSFSELPTTLRERLTEEFDIAYKSDPVRREAYRCMLESKQEWLGRCVNYKVYQARTPKDLMTWKQANGCKERACDFCIETGRLCAGPIELDGNIKLAFFPLPKSYRGGVTWTELGYWCNPGPIV